MCNKMINLEIIFTFKMLFTYWGISIRSWASYVWPFSCPTPICPPTWRQCVFTYILRGRNVTPFCLSIRAKNYNFSSFNNVISIQLIRNQVIKCIGSIMIPNTISLFYSVFIYVCKRITLAITKWWVYWSHCFLLSVYTLY